MLQATRQWFRRNRTPIAIGAGVVGAGYLATNYVLNKINDARERMSSDRIAKENLRRRFEQNQEDCTYTVAALVPTVTTNVLEAMPTEKITLEIQQMKSASRGTKPGDSTSAGAPSIADTTITEEESRSNGSLQSESGVHASQIAVPPASATAVDGTQDGGQSAAKARKTKRQLWDDLTISSITRAFTLVYTLALLTVLTRIQLNLLGRRSYLSSVIALATGPSQSTISLENNDDDDPDHVYGSDFETNRKYLTFSWWLLNRGWIEVMERVESAVRDVFGHLSPRDLLSFDTFSQLTFEVRKKVEGGDPSATGQRNTKWIRTLLPPQTLEDYVLRESGVLGDNATTDMAASGDMSTTSSGSPVSSLRRLIDETSDLIESPAFTHVFTLLLDAGFNVLLNKELMQGAFDSSPAGPATGISPDSTTKAVLLPKMLSVLTRQAHVIGNGLPNQYLEEMERVRDLEAFAAVVYSSNWENEIRSQDDYLPAAAAAVARMEDGSAVLTEPALFGVKEAAPVEESPPTYAAATAKPSQATSAGDESLVLVDPPSSQSQQQLQQTQSSFESAWERATTTSTEGGAKLNDDEDKPEVVEEGPDVVEDNPVVVEEVDAPIPAEGTEVEDKEKIGNVQDAASAEVDATTTAAAPQEEVPSTQEEESKPTATEVENRDAVVEQADATAAPTPAAEEEGEQQKDEKKDDDPTPPSDQVKEVTGAAEQNVQ